MAYADIPHLRSTAHSVASALAPAIAAGSGAGTSPTVAVTGRDEAGVVSVTAGSTPGAAGTTIATVTFATPYSVAPVAVLVNDNAGVAAYATVTTTALTLLSHTGLTATDAYKFDYLVVGGA